MMSNPGSRTPLLLLVLCTGVIMCGTFWPFSFTWHPGREGMEVRRQVEWIPFTRLCPAWGIFCPQDNGLNIVMFIPVGALAAWLFGTGGGGKRHAARAAGFGFCLSLLIETTQYFIPARFPSTTDLLLNTFGASLGGWMFPRLPVAAVKHFGS